MKGLNSTLTAFFLLSIPPVSDASPIAFDYQYTFESGEVLSGMLEGEIQADNDTVQVTAILSSLYSGDTNLIWNTQLLAPNLASISGNTMMDVGLLGPFGGDMNSGWAIGHSGSTALIGKPPEIEGVPNFLENEIFSETRWSLVPESTVPIPGGVWLFGSAVGLLGWARRKSC